MDLIPPRDVPKPKLRKLVKALAIGTVAGAAVGAVVAFLADEPALLIAGPLGGALIGLWVWEQPPNVLWGRHE